jgi:hypothetical protein
MDKTKIGALTSELLSPTAATLQFIRKGIYPSGRKSDSTELSFHGVESASIKRRKMDDGTWVLTMKIRTDDGQNNEVKLFADNREAIKLTR